MSLTKAVNLNKEELEEVIIDHGRNLHDNTENRIERMTYLHKRLKSFSEPDTEVVKSNNSAAGWGATANG